MGVCDVKHIGHMTDSCMYHYHLIDIIDCTKHMNAFIRNNNTSARRLFNILAGLSLSARNSSNSAGEMLPLFFVSSFQRDSCLSILV